MVAPSAKTLERFVVPPPALVTGRLRVARFTVHDVDILLAQGVVPEDASTELLDGLIVLKDRSARGQDPAMIGDDHTKSVEQLSDLRIKLNTDARHVRAQQPLVCSDTHMPEPDFMVLRGRLKDYTGRPVAADAFCVVEVADSSYERDTGSKLVGYAKAQVQQYIVINLLNRTAEVYSNPDPVAGTYPPSQIIPESGILSLRVGDAEFFDVPLRDVLP